MSGRVVCELAKEYKNNKYDDDAGTYSDIFRQYSKRFGNGTIEDNPDDIETGYLHFFSMKIFDNGVVSVVFELRSDGICNIVTWSGVKHVKPEHILKYLKHTDGETCDVGRLFGLFGLASKTAIVFSRRFKIEREFEE